MFGWKKYRFKFEKVTGCAGGYFWLTVRDSYIQYLIDKTDNYIPELAELKPGESMEIEIRIKGRK